MGQVAKFLDEDSPSDLSIDKFCGHIYKIFWFASHSKHNLTLPNQQGMCPKNPEILYWRSQLQLFLQYIFISCHVDNIAGKTCNCYNWSFIKNHSKLHGPWSNKNISGTSVNLSNNFWATCNKQSLPLKSMLNFYWALLSEF